MAPGDARSVTVLASFRIRPGTNRADFVIGEPEMVCVGNAMEPE